MQLKGLVLGLLLSCAVSVITEEDDVWVLTDDNFNEALDKQPSILVEFYAPWCGHCKSLAPEYAKAAKTLLQQTPPIRIAKVDATQNTDLATRFSISGYPTLKYFVNKEPTEYKGGRTEDSIVSWILKQSQPLINIIDCLCEFDSILSKNKVVATLFAEKETPEAQIFEDVAEVVDGVHFVLSLGNDGVERYGITQPALILFKQFDEKRIDFTGEFTEDAIRDFLNKNKKTSVIKFDEEAIQLIFRDQNPVIFLFSADYSQFEADFVAVSQEYKKDLLFCSADVVTTDNGRLGEFLGVPAEAQPTALILDTRTGLNKFKLEGAVSQDSLKQFIKDWQEGKAEQFVKSAEIPAESHENNVRVLVGKNFNEVALDPTKDVLVEFYAPWCGHCKELAPHYEKLATDLKENPNVVIAKVDGTQNEVKGIDIRGFPTIKFFSANDKNPIDFNGERDYDGLLKFINEKGTATAAKKTDL